MPSVSSPSSLFVVPLLLAPVPNRRLLDLDRRGLWDVPSVSSSFSLFVAPVPSLRLLDLDLRGVADGFGFAFFSGSLLFPVSASLRLLDLDLLVSFSVVLSSVSVPLVVTVVVVVVDVFINRRWLDLDLDP